MLYIVFFWLITAITVTQESPSKTRNKDEIKRVKKNTKKKSQINILKSARCQTTFSWWKPVSDTEEKTAAAWWVDGYV